MPKAKGKSPEELRKLRKKYHLGEFAPKVKKRRRAEPTSSNRPRSRARRRKPPVLFGGI